MSEIDTYYADAPGVPREKLVKLADYNALALKLDTIRAGVAPLVRAARSWHDFHHGSTIVQCDAICETLPAAEEALK